MMDFSELAASAPWENADRPAADGLQAILGAFLQHQLQGSLPVLLPPPGGEYSIGEFAHPWPEIFLQIRGERSFKFSSGRVLVLHPGEMAVIPRGVEHHERVADLGAGQACLVWMCLPGRIDLHVAVQGIHGSQKQRCGDAFADFGAGGDHLCDEICSTTQATVQHALTTILLAHARQAVEGTSLYASNRSTLIDQCLRSISFKLHVQDLGVASLAEELGCSTSHLGRQFKAVMDETLVGYIARRRVELAEDLLLEGRTSVAAVARACGFSDAGYFSRVFSRIKGTSPVMTRRKTPSDHPVLADDLTVPVG